MDFNFSDLSSTFKHLANHTASGRKTAIGGSDSHDTATKSSYRLVRDEFTLSDAGRTAYEKFFNKSKSSEPQPEGCESNGCEPQTEDFIPQIIVNADGTAVKTNADGSTTPLQVLTAADRPVRPPSETVETIIGGGKQVPKAVSDAVNAYREFYQNVEQELLSLFPPDSNSPGIGLPGSAKAITHNLFSQAKISDPFTLFRGEGVEDMTAWTADFDAFRTQVTKGLQDLKEIEEIRARLAFEGDRGLFSSPLNRSFPTNVIEHVLLGTNEVVMESPMGPIMARGQSTDLNWLRQVDKAATKEGLQAAFARENNQWIDNGNGYAGPSFSYYNWEKGTQTLVKISIAHSLDGNKTFLDDKDKPFTITVTEYSLKDGNDKGTVLAGASGTDYFSWLNSSDNFLPHIGDKGFQNWRTETAAWSPWLGTSDSASSNSTRAQTFLTKLGKLFGLDGTFTSGTSLLNEVDKLIEEEGKELNKLLSAKLKEAGMGDVTKKITFAEDKDGNIVIEGNISARQKKKLAQLINDDTELAERIKTQKARMELADGLKQTNPELHVHKNGGTERAHIWEDDVFNDKKYDAARTQLLKNLLEQNGASLDDVDTIRTMEFYENKGGDKHKALFDLLSGAPGLADEINAYIDRRKTGADKAKALEQLNFNAPVERIKMGEGNTEKSPAVRSLLAMKRGELMEVTDDKRNFSLELLELRSQIFKALEHVADEENPIDGYNTTYSKVDPNWIITGFDIEFDHRGKMTFSNVETVGGCEHSKAAATRALHVLFKPDMAGDLGTAILEAHDDEHGDVEEFKHNVVASGGSYEVFSPDADKAALEEMAELTQEIGAALGTFFGDTMGIKSPFAVLFGEDGFLSLDEGSLTFQESQAVRKVLEQVNAYITAEQNGEDTEGMLSAELTGIADKFIKLKEVQDKIHDKSLLPKEGIRFAL